MVVYLHNYRVRVFIQWNFHRLLNLWWNSFYIGCRFLELAYSMPSIAQPHAYSMPNIAQPHILQIIAFTLIVDSLESCSSITYVQVIKWSFQWLLLTGTYLTAVKAFISKVNRTSSTFFLRGISRFMVAAESHLSAVLRFGCASSGSSKWSQSPNTPYHFLEVGCYLTALMVDSTRWWAIGDDSGMMFSQSARVVIVVKHLRVQALQCTSIKLQISRQRASESRCQTCAVSLLQVLYYNSTCLRVEIALVKCQCKYTEIQSIQCTVIWCPVIIWKNCQFAAKFLLIAYYSQTCFSFKRIFCHS